MCAYDVFLSFDVNSNENQMSSREVLYIESHAGDTEIRALRLKSDQAFWLRAEF